MATINSCDFGTGTSGQLLTSNGPGVAPTFQDPEILSVTKVIDSSHIKNLVAAPVEVIAAPGSGKVIYIMGGWYKLTYGGSNVFTGTTDLDLSYNFDGITEYLAASFCSGTLVGSSVTQYLYLMNGRTVSGSPIPATAIENKNIQFLNPSGVDITGNAANDNTITIYLKYFVVSI